MSTREERIKLLAEGLAADYKILNGRITSADGKTGTLSNLNTTAKSNVVAAINEVLTLANEPKGAQINDAATNGATTVVWSADKVYDAILEARNAVKAEILGSGTTAALDTLKELATALGNDANFATTIATGLNNRVRFDAAQTLTVAQQKTASVNIGMGDPDYDFLAAYSAAKVAT